MSTTQALKENRDKMIVEYLARYPTEAAKDLEAESVDSIIKLFKRISINDIGSTIEKLSNDVLIELFSRCRTETCSALISIISVEQLHDVMVALKPKRKDKMLSLIPQSKLEEIREIQRYSPDTAGSIMDSNIIQFYPEMTVAEAIEKIKSRKKKGIRLIFIIDQEGRPHSMSSMQELIVSEANELLGDISKPIPALVTDMTPKDEILETLEQLKLTDMPVVNIDGRFVGVVRYHALIKVAKEELTKGIQKMVGVSEDERALSKVSFSVRKRLPWLEVNLLTAFLAASVVGFFENTIAQFTALAVLLPVVAGQSGNTGAQALAVTMRGLALKEIRTSHWLKLILKELKISCITGLVVAITTAAGVYVWSGSLGLTLIIGVSMVLSMVLASMSGAAVPLILARLGQDPASSSSILLTTVTDICGFMSFLGIATLLSRLI
ncbi:MAG: hypothetical protein CMF48_02690 [Legionellales bacterium]|nr:hypothetical protein [Legionellales bacterium]|tara:strand:- start:789 stop:2102 length:1314 start_codon:yes stop_codon:yes gene_type:complete